MRLIRAAACVLSVAGCTAFPRSPQQAVIQINDIVDAIECELAAVATNNDPIVRSRDIMKWTAATQVDLTLVRSISADGSVGIAGPWGIATVSGTPSGSISDADTRINSIKFANSFQKAVDRFQYTCSGPDPSETGMGLANWFEGSVRAIDKDSLVSLSFTKQFNIVAAASARFGYTLLPVTNPVTASAGLRGSSDYTNRFTIALTPPAPPPKPLNVYVTNFPGAKQSMIPEGSPGADQTTQRRAPAQPASPRQRVLQDPALNQALERQSPVILQPGSVVPVR